MRPSSRTEEHRVIRLALEDRDRLPARVPHLLPRGARRLRPRLGIGHDATDDPESNALRETIDDLSLAIADYARVLAGEVVRGDEASEDRFRRAVAPIDAFREALSRRHGAGDEPEPETDIEDPLPEVHTPTPVIDEPAPVPVEG